LQYGADLNTCNGEPCGYLGTGKVTITDSKFDENYHNPPVEAWPFGLRVRARGAISLAGVSASNNGVKDDFQSWGAILDNSWSPLVSPITITNSSFIANHKDTANLEVYTKGVIILTNVRANENGEGGGAILDNTSSSTFAGVSVQGSPGPGNDFSDNAGTGLIIRTDGSISLSGVSANYNDGLGLDLVNIGGTGDITFKSGLFDHNSLDNLTIITNGAITLTNVYSSWSLGGIGIYLNNIGGIKPLSFTQGSATYNSSSGLYALSNGAVTLTGLITHDNSLYGIYVNNSDGTAGVTLKDCSADYNGQTGVYILTKGADILTNTEAIYNHKYGVKLGFAESMIIPKSVTITNADIAYNGDTIGGYDNLNLISKSFVTLKDVAASHCAIGACNGASLGDYDYSLPIPGAVTINGGNFDDNREVGLWVYAKGNIALSEVVAWFNEASGAVLDNTQGAPLHPTISISNSEFNQNTVDGLRLTSLGAITITNIKTNYNTNGGAAIQNYSGNISLLTTGDNSNEFIMNEGTNGGLALDTPGSVVLNNLYVSGNNLGYGVSVYNSGGTGYVGNVTVTGGIFDANQVGLSIPNSNGVILVSGIEATDNSSEGALFNNTADTYGTKGVTISRSIFDNNHTGLEVHSWGQITLNAVSASHSTSGTGAILDNQDSTLTTPKGISVLGKLGANNFDSNTGGHGLTIFSKGTVIVTDTSANDNAYYGIYINNWQSGFGKGTVSLSDLNVNRSGMYGIYIVSNNAVTLASSTIMFTSSPYDGIYIKTYSHNLNISDSLIAANKSRGLFAELGTGIFKMTSTFYFGNCTTSGTENIRITH
jgi:hypothetical protein